MNGIDHHLRYVIAVDFDGTLCEIEQYPKIGEPKRRIINALKRRQQEGAAIILWTNRCGKPLEDAVSWCAGQGLYFDTVNESLPEWIEFFGNDPRKIGANEYWDDRAATPYMIEQQEESKI